MADTAARRRALAGRLSEVGVLVSPRWRAAVEAVPRELFLNPGVFLLAGAGRWRPVTPVGCEPDECAQIAYRDESLTTQLDGHLTADQICDFVACCPSSSSTTPVTVVDMIVTLPRQGTRGRPAT